MREFFGTLFLIGFLAAILIGAINSKFAPDNRAPNE